MKNFIFLGKGKCINIGRIASCQIKEFRSPLKWFSSFKAKCDLPQRSEWFQTADNGRKKADFLWNSAKVE